MLVVTLYVYIWLSLHEKVILSKQHTSGVCPVALVCNIGRAPSPFRMEEAKSLASDFEHYAKWGDTCTMMCAVTSGSHRSQILCAEQQFQILPCVAMWETAIACTFGVSSHPCDSLESLVRIDKVLSSPKSILYLHQIAVRYDRLICGSEHASAASYISAFTVQISNDCQLHELFLACYRAAAHSSLADSCTFIMTQIGTANSEAIPVAMDSPNLSQKDMWQQKFTVRCCLVAVVRIVSQPEEAEYLLLVGPGEP